MARYHLFAPHRRCTISLCLHVFYLTISIKMQVILGKPMYDYRENRRT